MNKKIKVLQDGVVDIVKGVRLKKGEIKEVRYNSYWSRRIKDGSVEVVGVKVTPKVQINSKTKRVTKRRGKR